MPSPGGPRGLRRPRRAGVALVLYAAFTAVCTWPWLADPAHLAPPYADLLGHVWGLAWVAHQAVRDPLHLYDANMYWPQSLSLAYTESLLPQSVVAAPVFAAGGGALLAHNLVLLLTFPLAGVFAYLLAWDFTRSRLASFLAGLAFAFTALRFQHVVHVGVLSFQWLPLVLWLWRRAVLKRSLGVLAAFAAALAVQALSSGYYAVLLALLMLAAAPFFVGRAARRGSLRGLVLACVAAGLVVAALAWPYAVLAKRHGLGRGRDTFLHWSATPAGYLSPGEYVGLPHQEALRAAARGAWPLFPGTAVLLLAPLGIGRSRGARLALTLTVVGAVLSFGPELRLGSVTVPMPLEWLRRFPPGSLLRDPARLGVLAHLGLALLTAFGLRRVSRWRGGAAIAAGLVALQAVEAYPVGLGNRVRVVKPPPAVTAWLAAAPRGPVLELPWDHDHRGGGLYLYWSTAHWQPLVNGHGTFAPAENFRLAVLVARFPTGRTSRILRHEGIRYVVVHAAEVTAERRAALVEANAALPPGVALVAQSGSDFVYEIDASGPSEPRPAEVVAAPGEDEGL